MKKEEQEKIKWRKLDNSAKLFPIISNKKFSSVFRLSVVLKEEIKKEILQIALEETLDSFKPFKVKLKKGFFWYYFEENLKKPMVEEESTYPCRYIDKNENQNYLFRVTYFKNKINFEVFHSLTDGNSASHFMKELTYHYLDLAHKELLNISNRKKDRVVEFNNTEDEYIKNYDKKLSGHRNSKKAYILKGEKLPIYAVGVTHQILNFNELKALCKQKEVTVTQYLTSVLIEAIYQENYKNCHGNKPIKVCIPVNLKKYFNSSTIANFFSYITVEANVEKNQLDSFEKILGFVKQDFQRKLTEEEVVKTMSSDVKLGNHMLIRMIPLFLKKFTVKMSYTEIQKYTTTTFSNIGRIGILPEYKEYIENFMLLIAPERIEKIKCSACSFENKLVFTFTSILKERKIEKAFFEHFKKEGISIKIESNGVYEDVIS